MELIARDAVLAHTLATEFVPASNLRGEVAGAAWRYLLPTLVHDRVLCIGRPPRASLRTLGATSREVVILAAGSSQTDRALRWIAPPDAARWLAAEADGSLDLVVVAAGASGVLDSTGWATLAGRLAPDATVVIEQHDGPTDASGSMAGLPAPLDALTAGRATAWVRVRPDRGEVRSAVAHGDRLGASTLRERGLAGPLVRLPGPRRLGRLVDRVVGERRPRWLAIALPAGSAPPPAPPAYLVALAAAAGLDISGWRLALSATGDYNTQKVLALLSAPGAERPTIIVKMTRDTTVVPRLETERDALRALADLGIAAGRVPTVLFAGRHAGLAVVGQTVVDGRPYGAASLPAPTRATDPDPAGRPVEPVTDALAWLTELGQRSARPAANTDVADALTDLLLRFTAMCRPEAALVERLRAAIEAVRTSDRPFPLVFQHGDPGTWNLLVRDDGSAIVLDWENADAAGMPLWDLFYLLRSHAVGTGRRAGTRRRLAAVERYLFDTSPLTDLVVASVHAYADRVGLARDLIEPLFHLCWMHQAMKESTRVAPERVARGHYNRLLRLGLERRHAPTLQRLFGAAT